MKILDDVELKDLLLEMKRGSESAFNRIYLLTFKLIYQKVFTLVRDENAADDITQLLFIKIWKNREAIDTDRNFINFISIIAENLVFDFYRKLSRDARMISELMDQASTYYVHTDSTLEDKESMEILLQAVSELSPQRREVFKRCRLEGKSYQQTSDELGVSIATVNSHMTHATKQVREFLLKNYGFKVLLFFLLRLFS